MNTYVLTLACLCAGLLFDPNGFLRMSLVASLIHELGHIIVYVIAVKKLPSLSFSVGGIALKDISSLSTRQEFFVTLAGPLLNFLAALLLYISAQFKSSYFLMFFIAVNICIGVYNLLPFGMLDGARLLLLLLPACKADKLYTINKCLVIAFSVILFAFVFLIKANILIRVGFAIAAIYFIITAFKK